MTARVQELELQSENSTALLSLGPVIFGQILSQKA
jgi:hypothetical protein